MSTSNDEKNKKGNREKKSVQKYYRHTTSYVDIAHDMADYLITSLIYDQTWWIVTLCVILVSLLTLQHMVERFGKVYCIDITHISAFQSDIGMIIR